MTPKKGGGDRAVFEVPTSKCSVSAQDKTSVSSDINFNFSLFIIRHDQLVSSYLQIAQKSEIVIVISKV